MHDGLLGEGQEIVCDGIVIERPEAGRIRLVAERETSGLASGRFSLPSVGVRWPVDAWPTGVEFLGFGFTQFALPVTAGPDLRFDFRPSPGLRSPRAVLPLVARASESVTLVAPVDHPHEQIVAVGDGWLQWGWHGDLDHVPAGFVTTLGVYEGSSVAEVLDAWRADIDPLRRRATNAMTTHLSYWTDNGAAYWYRTEPGETISESVVSAVEALRRGGVPVRAVELDSWFYEHETPRPIAEDGYPAEVPPTGTRSWTPRADAFPTTWGPDPMDQVASRLRAPLVLHARHISPTSPYVGDGDGWWVDEGAAQPVDATFFRRWFEDAARWGATCIEQDWMLMYWFGVRALREEPGRAAAWQSTLNELARESGVDLMWCMATPADLIHAAHLDRVAAVRTSDDYRFADDPAFLWTWFLTVNRLANALGLPAFKDCFFSNPAVADGDDAIDGDVHAELEAALSALSGGPVGIGDRRGRTDRDVVMRTCDDDGRLRRVDRAIAAEDRCLFGGPGRGEGLMWATTTATDDLGQWTYVLAIHTAETTDPITDRFQLPGRRDVYDWRAGASGVADVLVVELEHRSWALFVVSPDHAPSAAEVGDPTRYVVVEAAPTGVGR